MNKHLFLIKNKQSQLYDETGKRLAVTYCQIPKTVVLAELDQSDQSKKVRVGIKEKALAKCKKAQREVFTKAGAKSGFYFIREITVKKDLPIELGQDLPVEQILSKGDWVQVRAKNKGRGFAGVIKRWGFKGGPRSHGQSDRERAIGSIGGRTDPGRVWKGKKMPGHMGNKNKTIGALNVLAVRPEAEEIIIKGLVPGPAGSLIALAKLDYKAKIIKLWQEDSNKPKEVKKPDNSKDANKKEALSPEEKK